MIILIRQLHVYIAGKNFTVTQMRTIKKETFYDYFFLSSPHYTVLKDNSVFPSLFSFSGLTLVLFFSPNLSLAEKERKMEENVTKGMSFPFRRATESC